MPQIKKAGMMRRTIASNMQKSWNTAPKCDYYMKLDAGPMMKCRKRFNEEHGANVSYLNMVMKAVAVALCEFPEVNATYNSEDNTYILHDSVNVGFAMNVGGGLMVLCTRDTDKAGMTALSETTRGLIEKAKARRVENDDVSGSTFTVNNMGSYRRLEYHSAIINQPESAILSVYSIVDEPAVVEGTLVVGKRMHVALSADHRLIDGGLACAFLERVCELLEAPEPLFG